jgi:hypothetical protein
MSASPGEPSKYAHARAARVTIRLADDTGFVSTRGRR